MKTNKDKTAAGIAVSLLFALAAMAQTGGTGAITGTITDPGGAVVPQAEIKVTNVATGESRSAMSGAAGTYSVPLLPPGTYRVEITKSGFKVLNFSSMHVVVTETATVNARLEIGRVSEQVLVNAEGEQLQTSSAALGRVTDERMVMSLPLVTRNYTQIIGLNPGVSADVTVATDLGRGGGGMSNFSTAGGQTKDNNYQMDGMGANDLQNSGSFSGGAAIPNPDTIQEFKVQTSQYDATYGRNAGANVNVVTKGGSNALHGTLFEFFRNEDLNANGFFNNQAGQPTPILRQNQYGGTIGGPIKKDKLFFFGSYQGTRQLNGSGSTCSSNFREPPLTDDRSRAALGRLFSGQRGFYQGALGNVGPSVAADGSNISAQAFALLNMKFPNGQYVIPTPQRIDLSQPFATQGFSADSSPCTFTENQYMANADYIQSTKSRFAFRYFMANSDQDITFQTANLGGPTAPGWPVLNPNKFKNASITHTYIFSPSLLNELELGYHRQWVLTNQTEPVQFSDFGVTAPSYDNGIPELNFQNALPTLGGNGQSLNSILNTFQLQDSLSYVHGKQSLRFGAGFTRSQDNLEGFHFLAGLIFLSTPDFLLGLNATQNGTAAAGLPVSNVYESIDLPGLFDRAWRVWDTNWYVQDDVKLTHRLTLNLGLRWEHLGNLSDKLGRNSDVLYRLVNPNPPASGSYQGFTVPSNYSGPIPTGVTQLGAESGNYDTNLNTWNPRVGFAWQLPHTDRFVLRGGYGIYHSRTTGQPFIQLLTAAPFAIINQPAATANASATLASPFPAPATIPSFPAYSPSTALGPTTIDQDYRPPSVQRYSMGLQTKLPGSMVLEIGYTGARDTHLIRQRSVNQALLASPTNPIRGVTTNTTTNIALRVPYQGFSAPGFTVLENAGAAWYNALDASLEKRFSHGLQFLASYTYARLLSTDSNASNGGNGGLAQGDQNNQQQRYGPDNFVRDQRFVLSGVYNLPGPKSHGTFLAQALGGWQLASVVTIQSGNRMTITATNAANVFGITSDRAQIAASCPYPQLVNSGPIESLLNGYFNKSCFTTAPVIGDDKKATTFGNSGIGIVRGPGQANFDISIGKQFAVRWPAEHGHLEFRSEFFNAFNHTQFGNPGTSSTSSTFGIINTTSVNPRVLQFALKYAF